MATISTIPRAIFDTAESLKLTPELTTAASYPDYATTDYRLAREFLLAYKNNKETFKSYRREVERFLQWAWLIRQESILNLKRDDLTEFITFCQKPPKSWIGLSQVPRYLVKAGQTQPNPNWRPFVAELSKLRTKNGEKPTKEDFSLSMAALKIVFAALSSFYNFLLQEERLSANPVALIRQKNHLIRKNQNATPIRRLSQLQWSFLLKAAKLMAEEQPNKHNRTLFIVQALYGMYLRISELTASERWTPQMNSFYKDSDNNWWLKVVGKGNKERDISVSDEMLLAFKQYRTSLGLPPLPMAIEDTPLIPKLIGTGGISDTRYIRGLVQACFDRAYELMVATNNHDEALELKIATVHWLRHTGISDDVKIRPREHVRDDAGHSSGAITDRYIDVEKRERHRTAKHKKLQS